LPPVVRLRPNHLFMKMPFAVLALCGAATLVGCKSHHAPATAPSGTTVVAGAPAARVPFAPSVATIGRIERVDGAAMDALIAPNAVIEVLAEGFDWSEGPVWMGDRLLFSDVPTNTVYQWKAGEPVTPYLRPSGYTGRAPRGGEMGSNGLTRDQQGRLILCQHGDRAVARLEPDGRLVPLARWYRFHRFNSPNDIVQKSNGDFYFTDPPYGLEKNMDDPAKDLPYQGVYRIGGNGEVTLLTRELSRPNGIAFSPDEKTLYVANSDPKQPIIMSFPVLPDGTLGAGKVFFDFSAQLAAGGKGLPDGLKVDLKGNLFATAPGGVQVVSADGRHLGTIATGEATANCAWGENGSVLYITADMYLCRVKTLTRGRP